MDNETRKPRKRVTKKMAQRRRLIALAIIALILLLGIILICKGCMACISSDDADGNKSSGITTAVSTTVNPALTQPVVTTTVPVTTVDPNNKVELETYTMSFELGDTGAVAYITSYPENSDESNEVWSSSDENVATVNDYGYITPVGAGECIITISMDNNTGCYAEVKVTVTDPNGTVSGAGETATTANSAVSGTEASGVSQTSTTVASAEATQLSETPNGFEIEVVDGKTYVDDILIANKSYTLPSDYDPGLDPTAESQFYALSAAAAQEGLNIWLASGYRSYNYQYEIYNTYVSQYGKDTADTFSSRPGYSDHQTGLAIDVNSIDDSFGDTAESDWLAAHAHEYGFIIRYPEGKESVTGYKYEPWHIRYIGVEKATAVYNSGLSLEEYLGIDSYYHD
jgi:D-alanyl-D-alanine carboxypeptidase